MTVTQIIDDLHRRGVELQATGDKLRFRPKAAVPPDLLERMRENKAEIITALEITTVRARVRGGEEAVKSAASEVCFHCDGNKVCICALCAVPGLGLRWKRGPCRACLGTGRLCWPERAV